MAKKAQKKWLNRWQIQDVKCPRCWAKPGKPCTDQAGAREASHMERVEFARVVHGHRPRPPKKPPGAQRHMA